MPHRWRLKPVVRHFCICSVRLEFPGKRQTTPRMDRHETIVTGRCETFRYCHIGGKGMTSAELKHRVKLQEWAARIQDCRSSGLSVRAWCRQEEINAATYYLRN